MDVSWVISEINSPDIGQVRYKWETEIDEDDVRLVRQHILSHLCLSANAFSLRNCEYQGERILADI